jgi:SP family general alpha glucoside:H+ symporter-like MFS transporter
MSEGYNLERLESTPTGFVGTLGDVKDATDTEHKLTAWQAIKTYRKAVFWSIAISFSCVMEGCDSTNLGGFFGQPSFQRHYGNYYEGIGYQISAPWQVGLNMGSNVGQFFGIMLNGYIAEKYGYRRVLLVSYVLICAFIFITFFSKNIVVLFIGEFLCGWPWAQFAIIAPTYASEVCPVALRGFLTTFVNLCWVIGGWIGSGIGQAMVRNPTEWAYRIPFAIQWVWPIPLFILVWLAPESPWWLVRRGKLEEAESSVRRLLSPGMDVDPKQQVAMMVHTVNAEREIEKSATYLECFKGFDLRRTEIAFFTFFTQPFSGYVVGSYTTYFFEQAGLDPSDAYKLGVGDSAIGFIGTCCSWFLLNYFGRRTIYIFGYSSIVVILILIGILGSVPQNNSVEWAQACLMLIQNFLYDSTIGPIVFTIVSEVGRSSLRSKTIAIGRDAYMVSNILNSVITPYCINPTQGNWKGKAGYFAGGLSSLCVIWAYFRLPEFYGRTYEEIDIMFTNRVSARKFSEFEVDVVGNEKLDIPLHLENI